MKPFVKNEIQLLPGDLVKITLTRGKVALIDLADLPKVAEYRWCAVLMRNRSWYAAAHQRGSRRGSAPVRMHNVLLGHLGVDHIDGDGLNNRRNNLRPATDEQNKRNRRISKNNTSGYKGVFLDRGRWRACIDEHGRRHYLGYFATAEEAARAYDAAAREGHGEFANLNFPVVH